MLLKSLELQGFKTFPDKTKLTFEDGISAVVGPNGSGKSNISDAMRWVLGEQSAKALRCVKMEDVIFSGTPSRKAQGFAEVTLTIDNTSRYLPYDGDTVSITRRYYRSGESEYLINKATVRLKDIHELFMDTGLGRDGYSMIGQGKIDSVISAKSEERREIFEEAAGISRYRYRKEESERKLCRAEENLLRLQDILQELEGRVGPLKEQAEKAKTYLALYQEKRRLEIGLWLYTLDQSGKILTEHEEKLSIARSQHDGVIAEIEELDRQIETLFQETNRCLAQAEQARNGAAKGESEAAAKEGEASVLENELRHNEQTIVRLTEERSRFGGDDEQTREKLREKQGQISQCNTAIAEHLQQCQQAEARLGQLRKTMDLTDSQVAVANEQLQRLSAESARAKLIATQASSTAEEIDLRLSAIAETFAQREAQKADLEDQQKEQRQSAQKAEQAEASVQASLRETESKLAQRLQSVEKQKAERDRIYLDLQETCRRAKILEDLERNLEGFAHSVKTVMRMAEKGQLTGIHGPVSRLLTVPRSYAVAIETALGGAAQHIVVSTEEDAKAAIHLLKRKDGGRATFLPLSTIAGKPLREPALSQCDGFVGIAGELCQCDPQYKGVLQSLLGRIVVAETLDHAVAIARRFRYSFRVVTLDGQVVNAGGSMTGGSLSRKNGFLSRGAEIAALREKAALLQTRYDKTQQQVCAFAEETEQLKSALEVLRQRQTEAANERVQSLSDLHRLESELSSVMHQILELTTERTFTEQRRGDLDDSCKQAEEQQKALAQQMMQVQSELAKLSGGRTALQTEFETLTGQFQELRFGLLTLQKDREALILSCGELEEKLRQSTEQAQRITAELETTRLQNAALTEQMEKAKQDAQTLRKAAQAQKETAERLQQERLMLEQQSVQLRSREKERSSSKETIGRELSRLEERKLGLQRRYDEIIEQLWNEYELTRREAEAEGETITDEAGSTRRLRELKSKIKSLGSVNLSAVEEYQEVSERYAFLTEQVNDVEQSKKELHKLIRDLTRQMTDIFKERFTQINTYFQTTFTELFGGGKAHLELSDPEDVLHSGIVILAQPPGKIVKNLELLSGGEKALVAVSLYFAIMKVSPPPFCMLDEIEAALDDVNVVRFAEYLRKMNENTQFIVITHRRGTMEEADVLYGVTMQEEGISKLLKLDPSEVGKKLGIK